jgi:hypothetical protein
MNRTAVDLIRASIHLRKKVVSKKMDHRVKPGDDDLTARPGREPSPVRFVFALQPA